MMKNKSTIAKLLATEDIFVVYKQMETAYFDSKKRELGLPIWKEEEMTKDIIDLMTCHEIGHALWTPLDMLEKSKLRGLNHSFVNILEDARIEKKVKNKYPGSVGVFNRGYLELIGKDFFGTAGKELNSFNLIDRINMYFKGNSKIEFSEEEKVWVEKTAKTTTPDEVLDLAEEMYAWMEENAPEETEKGEDGAMGMADPNGEAGEKSDEGENNDKSDSNNGDSASDMGDSDDRSDSDVGDTDGDRNGSELEEEDGEEDGKSAGSASDNKSDDGPDASDDESVPSGDGSDEGGVESKGKGLTPKTDKSLSDGLDNLRDKAANDRVYGRIPKVDLKEKIIDTDTVIKEFYGSFMKNATNGSENLYVSECLKEVEALKKDSKKTVSYMVKEFEMKKSADAYARAATSKTGSLDMGKLHTYKYNEDLFKKVTTLPGATNHGMLLVLDWSGSMAENLKGTVSQLLQLVWFCRQTRIPFEVYAFSDRYTASDRYDYRSSEADNYKNFVAGDIVLHDSFRLFNLFSNKMSAADELKMMHALMMYSNAISRGYRDWNNEGYPVRPHHTYELGGTPLNDAIITMMTLAPKFKADTGVQRVNTVFLTDGCSNRLGGVYDYNLVTREDAPNYGEHTQTINPLGSSWNSRGYADSMITDPVTNKTTQMTGDSTTNKLLEILKDRVPEMNVIGFFIAGSGRSGRVDKRTIASVLNKSSYDVMDEVKFINKNKYLAVSETVGYDEYYILPGSGNLEVENFELSDELVGASKAKLKTAFGKSMKSRISSRQLLNKFVKLVA